jgi:hypothetical protein
MVSAFNLHKVKAAFVLSSARGGTTMGSNDVAPISAAAAVESTSNGNSIPAFAMGITSAKDTHVVMPDIVDGVNNLDVTQSQPAEIGPIHFCFIVHGHKGHANDLWYLHQTVRDKAIEHDAFHHVESSEKCTVGANLDAKSKQHPTDDVESNQRREKRDRLSLPQKIKAKLPHKRSKDSDDNISNEQSQNFDIKSKIDASDSSSNYAASELSADESKKLAAACSFIVHSPVCNEDKTDDGVANGGNRLANEILEVIRYEVEKKTRLVGAGEEPVDVTISLIGNSLGGLYTRYAVARLAEISQEPAGDNNDGDTAQEPKEYYIFADGRTFIRLHFNVFCTTASPHLGCADHTYFPIPRVAEKGIAYGMGETGRDLFRVSSLLHEMATEPRFLEPLARFRKRIAYANAFGTDFVVPTQTAAFLDEDSRSLHYVDEYFEEDIKRVDVDEINQDIDAANTIEESAKKKCPAKELGLVIATFHTKRGSFEHATNVDCATKDLTIMSSTLDALGWKKVFVDIRKEMPLAVSIPIGSNAEPARNCPIQKLKSAKVVESRDLAKAVSGNPSRALISLPLGHNAIVAMSRGAVTLAMNGGGTPVVDSLAMHLTEDISSWCTV